jgi:hypothetical protein
MSTAQAMIVVALITVVGGIITALINRSGLIGSAKITAARGAPTSRARASKNARSTPTTRRAAPRKPTGSGGRQR